MPVEEPPPPRSEKTASDAFSVLPADRYSRSNSDEKRNTASDMVLGTVRLASISSTDNLIKGGRSATSVPVLGSIMLSLNTGLAVTLSPKLIVP